MTIYSKRDLNARRKRALCLCASASAAFVDANATPFARKRASPEVPPVLREESRNPFALFK